MEGILGYDGLEEKRRLLLEIRQLPTFSFLEKREIAPINRESPLKSQAESIAKLFREIHNEVIYNITPTGCSDSLIKYGFDINFYHEFDKIYQKEQEEALLMLAEVLSSKELDIPIENSLKIREWFNDPVNRIALEEIEDISFEVDSLGCFPLEFFHLKNLQKITIENCQLRTIPRELCSLVDLREINLAGNNISNVPKEISNLTKLIKMDLSRNYFGKFPEELCAVSSLIKLNLSGTSIKKIPSEIKNLTYLECLALSGNQFKNFPEEVWALERLKELYLNRNKIKYIPPRILYLTNLEKLEVSGNKIQWLANQIETLTKLLLLDISNNESLSFLPEGLEDKNTLTIKTDGTLLNDGGARKRGKFSASGQGGGSK
jgi:hypothetical protein